MAAERRARAVWEGTLTSPVFSEQSVTWAARTEDPGGWSTPKELSAAAHAACCAMALSAADAIRGNVEIRLTAELEG